MEDRRKFKRFEVEVELTWAIESQNLTGKGYLLDVSQRGACFRMQQPFVARAGLVFTIDAPDVPALPRRGKLNWYRKLPGRAPLFLCGVVFEDDANPAWDAWLEQALAVPDAEASA
jgi:PilZ domain